MAKKESKDTSRTDGDGPSARPIQKNVPSRLKIEIPQKKGVSLKREKIRGEPGLNR